MLQRLGMKLESFLNAMDSRAKGVAGNKLDGDTFAIDSDFATKIRNTKDNEVRIFCKKRVTFSAKTSTGKTPKAKEDYAKYKRGYAKFVVNRTAAKRGETLRQHSCAQQQAAKVA